MSWEAWGDPPEPVDVDDMYRHGWDSDPDCKTWWKVEEPEKTYTFEEAAKAYEERL